MQTSPNRLMNWLAFGLIVVFVGVLLAAVIVPKVRGTGVDAGAALAITETPTLDSQGSAFMFAPNGAVLTTEEIGDIPANTRVNVVGTISAEQGWVFQIRTLDERYTATARANQLMLDPALDLNAPTPMPRYNDPVYWGECYPLVLTEKVEADTEGRPAKLKAGTRVRIASGLGYQYIEDHGWGYLYTVVEYPGDKVMADPFASAPSGRLSATVREDQLAPAPDVAIVEGVPTPISQYEIGLYPNGFVAIVDIGKNIPAGTRLSISAGYYGCYHWVYQIVTEDGLSAAVRQDQIAYAPDVTPATPVRTPTGPATNTPVLTRTVATATNTTVPTPTAIHSGPTPTATYTSTFGVPSPTPIGGHPGPSITPSFTPSPTYPPTPTMSGTPYVTTLKSPTPLYSGHSTVYNQIAHVPANTRLDVLGRNVPNYMILVRWDAAPGGQGWVSQFDVRAEGDFSQVPMIDNGPVPTATATLTHTPAP